MTTEEKYNLLRRQLDKVRTWFSTAISLEPEHTWPRAILQTLNQALAPDHPLWKGYPDLTMVPTDSKTRKSLPLCTGVLDYFSDALLAVAEVSRKGNEQHNPGEPLHWAKEKSTDEADSLLRHMVDRGKLDSDGTRHSAKVAWRALALLQREIEAERAAPAVPQDVVVVAHAHKRRLKPGQSLRRTGEFRVPKVGEWWLCEMTAEGLFYAPEKDYSSWLRKRFILEVVDGK